MTGLDEAIAAGRQSRQSAPLGLAAQRAKEKAEFCIATGMQPSEYDGLTLLERDAFIEAYNEANKE